MRVLIIHRYFWPDTPPYGWMLRAIAGQWLRDGHDVTVLTSQPSYGATTKNIKRPRTEMLDGFTVRRVGLLPESKKNFVSRGLNLGLFMLRIFIHIVFRRHAFDTIMAATTPPVLVAWAASLAAKIRGANFVYHCQDIHPELLNYAGLIDKGLAYRWLVNRDISTVNRSTRVVVLSQDMRNTLEARTNPRKPGISVINNFTVPNYAGESRIEVEDARKSKGKFRVLFAGNLGHFQGLGTVIEAARLLRENNDIEFVFLGDGAAKESLIAQCGDLVGRSVHFLGYRPQNEAEEFVRNADLSLITLGPDIYRAAFPSKTMTYLKMGSPILAIVEPESELASLVRDQDVGYVSPPGDAASIVSHVLDASRSLAAVKRMRSNALAVCEQSFGEQARLKTWSALLREKPFSNLLQPVFIIGAGRSGTKFVRDMLGAASDVAAVPFDVGYVWRMGNEAIAHDELTPELLSVDGRDYIRRTLPVLAGATRASRIMLEKSVPNSLRIGYLRAVYPNAKFVHLIRDGRAVTESSIRQWNAPVEPSYLLRKVRYFPWSSYRYAWWYIKNWLHSRFGEARRIWGPRYFGIERDVETRTLESVCARQWRRCVEKSQADLADLPADRVLTIRYEELVRDEHVVERLCQFIGTIDQCSVLNYYRDNNQAAFLEKWCKDLSTKEKDGIIREIGDLLQALGYTENDQAHF